MADVNPEMTGEGSASPPIQGVSRDDGSHVFGALLPQAVALREPAYAALGSLSDAARSQLAQWLRPTASERLRRTVRATLVRSHLRVASGENFASWPGGLLAHSLAQAFEVTQNPKDLEAVVGYGKWWMRTHQDKAPPNLDYVANGRLLLWLFHRSGSQDLLDAAKSMAAYVDNARKSPTGLMPYRQVAPSTIYIDSVGIVTPFIADYASASPDPHLSSIAASQIGAFMERGMDSVSGLPYHAFDDVTGEKLGAPGWGRGTGWLLLGCSEMLRGDASGRLFDQGLSDAYQAVCERVSEFQRPDGSFSWLLQAHDGPADASATALIYCGLEGAALARARNSEPQSRSLVAAVESLVSATSQRSVPLASAECGGLGVYPQAYGSYPWSVGPSILALHRFLTLVPGGPG